MSRKNLSADKPLNIPESFATQAENRALNYEEELKAYFITRIKKIRIEKNLSQRKLAEMMGVKQPEIARWEKGETVPNLTAVFKFCRAIKGRLEIIY